MPERGWSVLTVREETARKIKEMAQAKNLTVDEMISELISPAGKEGWSTCQACGVKVKTSNLREHMDRVHPQLTVKA
ncbi:MAG: hypothetical protein JRN16_01505 [Nitrososphaerota archaeon]|nr:hypothetical protein [Nitrososphaerota archaeon]MDG7019320.1 hypothetical protein [Nitrososphaerota archaeon]MDG7027069.1 hypothetical protein [Nitrososphaerota archaeon]